MPAREPVSAGVRGIAIAGDVTNSVIVTGDHATVQVRVDGEDALLARLLPAPGRTPRPAPPRDFPARAAEHIDRAAEAARLQGDFVSLELHGDADIGKTWVVRHALDGAAAPDGIVYLFAKAKAYGDLLQELFDAFYECDQVYLARTSQIRRDLREKQALVVLDSHALARDELRDLLTAMPRSRFVLVSRQRVLGEGEQLAVAGLAGTDALELVEQELARALLPDERADAQRVCEQLGGHPFKLRQAAARVRDGESSFAELATSSLAARMLTGLSEQETAIVAQLAALGGETIGAEHIAALLHEPDLSATLEDLRRRRVIASGSPRYRIAGALLEALERDTWPYPLAPRIDRALAHFAGWARAHRVNPSLVLTEAPALLELLSAAEANEQRGRVIELGRAIDGPFAWGRRWDTWGAVLVAVLRAARESADAGAEAWALHQSGTRAYCLGDVAGAVAALEEALRLREQLGDPAAAATRHNLDFIRGTPGGEADDGGGDPGPAPRHPRTLALLAALVVVIAISVTAVVRGSDKPTPTPVPPTATATECADGKDNDRDGTVDANDRGCDNGTEAPKARRLPQCRDGKDNDRDKSVDAKDPGCEDGTEAPDNQPPPECRDGRDNDHDGSTDSADPGCRGDGTEAPFNRLPQCRDGKDNDGDGYQDAEDPSCGDGTEAPDDRKPECADGIDNDGDGYQDGRDPGCDDGTEAPFNTPPTFTPDPVPSAPSPGRGPG